MLKIFSFISILTIASVGWSWGGRGHNSVCEAASFLVQEEGLKEIMAHRSHINGHLCNIPDIYWKSLGSESNKVGNPTHWFNPEIIGLKISEVPLDYQKIVTEFTGKPNLIKGGTIFSIPTEMGSNWWRADQLYRRAIATKDVFAKSSVPTNSKEEQDDNSDFNRSAYEFFVNLGIMGHFVGDNGQPFHSTVDHDGYLGGHGGIHSYYEEAVVTNLDYDLVSKVVRQGREFQKMALLKSSDGKVPFLTKKTVLEKMRALSEISASEVKTIFKLDVLKSPSVIKEEKGMQIRTAAVRPPARAVAKKFEKMIITDMGRSAALLAQLWDMAYVEVGRPHLKAYRSYKFPFQPEFITPDYYKIEKK